MKKNTVSVTILFVFIAIIAWGAYSVWERGDSIYSTGWDNFEFNGDDGDGSDYLGGSAEIASKGINEVELNWPVGAISVVEHDANTIIFTETSGKEIEVDNQLRYIIKDGKLEIRYSRRDIDPEDFFGGGLEKNLELKIPKNMNAVQTMEINTVSSELQIMLEQVGDLKINTVSGDVDIKGRYEDIECDGVSGDIDMNLSEVPKELYVNTISGEVRLTIPENKGFEAEHESVSGNFTCEFPVTSSKDRAVYKNPVSSFTFDSVSSIIRQG